MVSFCPFVFVFLKNPGRKTSVFLYSLACQCACKEPAQGSSRVWLRPPILRVAGKHSVVLSMFLCAFLNRDVFPKSEQFFCKGYYTQLVFFDGQEEGHVLSRTAGSAGSVGSVTYRYQPGGRDPESSLGPGSQLT